MNSKTRCFQIHQIAAGGFLLLSGSSLVALPTLIVNCIIGTFMASMRNIGYHYSIIASVCVFVALINGIDRLGRNSRLLGLERPAFCLVLTLLLIPGIFLGLADSIRYGSGQATSLVTDFLPKPRQQSIKKILALVSSDASVAAPSILMPHLSYRRKLYTSDRLWRYKEPKLDYIILDTRLDQLGDNDRNKPKYKTVVTTTRQDNRFRLVLKEDGFEVYRGITAHEPITPSRERTSPYHMDRILMGVLVGHAA